MGKTVQLHLELGVHVFFHASNTDSKNKNLEESYKHN